MQIKSIKEADVTGKRVFVRVGFDCPVEDGKITDSYRIDRGLETFRFLVEKGAKKIIVASKLGRPEGEYLEEDSLTPIVEEFKNRRKEIAFKGNIELMDYKDDVEEVMQEIDKKEDGIYFLENIRFWVKKNTEDLEFAKKIANYSDVYINDCFNVSHRKHPTLTGITEFLPSFAGFLVEEEVENIEKAIKEPKKPAIAVVGGAKLETKVPVIKKLLGRYDKVLVGGLVAVEIVDNFENFSSTLTDEEKEKMVLPSGFSNADREDINEETADNYAKILKEAKTILWNGPMGKFEEYPHDKGSRIVAEAIAKADAYTLAGGGETSEMLKKLEVFDHIDFISTGGGAMLDLIAGKELPALERLRG